MLKKLLLALPISVLIITIGGFVNSSSHINELRKCTTNDCLQRSQTLTTQDHLHFGEQNKEKEEKTTVVDYIMLLFTVITPTSGFLWWILTSQQDKKIFEENAKQTELFNAKINEILKSQQQNWIGHQEVFTKSIEKIETKFDLLIEQLSVEKIESLRRYYEHDNKINTLIKDVAKVENISSMVEDMENFLALKHGFKVRLRKTDVE